jgi:hypothetical protein
MKEIGAGVTCMDLIVIEWWAVIFLQRPSVLTYNASRLIGVLLILNHGGRMFVPSGTLIATEIEIAVT